MAIIFSFEPTASRPLAKPQAKLIEVDVCPIVKKSCSLSFGSVYPVTVLKLPSLFYSPMPPLVHHTVIILDFLPMHGR